MVEREREGREKERGIERKRERENQGQPAELRGGETISQSHLLYMVTASARDTRDLDIVRKMHVYSGGASRAGK